MFYLGDKTFLLTLEIYCFYLEIIEELKIVIDLWHVFTIYYRVLKKT